ncbi:uncharacterized protein Dwil_GK24630 [Drosophila willistoni]|uniref:Prothoracicotropic hormone n=1 Tax=Drosophila willistoni TaxID=7260 RepID=B4N0T1_DROWI|nr:uncharacterized protein Dwil_GK24630 [Drosophila willistoni]
MAALALLFILVSYGGGGRRIAAQSYGYDEDYNSKLLLNALFGEPVQSKAESKGETETPTESESLVLPHQYYNDFYDDLMASKRNDVHSAGCDCKVTNELIDLGNLHFPRYLMNAVCESRPQNVKCTHGSNCRPLEYKVKVLASVADNPGRNTPSSLTSSWLQKGPGRGFLTSSSATASTQLWQFKTVTVTAGCFCAK